MKKLYLITTLLLVNLHVFARGNFSKISDDTWVLLIIFAVILIIILTYLFLHAYLEDFFRNKEIEKVQESNDNETDKKEIIDSGSPGSKSDEILNLFMLKRKGIISDQEYQQLKNRFIIKSRIRQ